MGNNSLGNWSKSKFQKNPDPSGCVQNWNFPNYNTSLPFEFEIFNVFLELLILL